MQAYFLVVNEKNVGNDYQLLVAKKRDVGYFFDGQVVPGGQKLNAAGKVVFPGGRRNSDESGTLAAAAREFKEETGVELDDVTEAWTLTGPGSSKDYGVAILNLKSRKSLQALHDLINVRLAEATMARADILDKTIKTFEELRAKYPKCPEHDELERVEIWDLKANEKAIKAWKNDADVGWFYDILHAHYGFDPDPK